MSGTDGTNRTKREKSRIHPKNPAGQRGQISSGICPLSVVPAEPSLPIEAEKEVAARAWDTDWATRRSQLRPPGLRFFLARILCGRRRPERILAADRKSGCALGSHPQSRRAESTENMGFSARSRRANQVRTFGAQVRTPAADGHGRCALTRSRELASREAADQRADRYARSAWTHSDDQVAQIAALIAEFGSTNATWSLPVMGSCTTLVQLADARPHCA
jgi:hypothetical protein